MSEEPVVSAEHDVEPGTRPLTRQEYTDRRRRLTEALRSASQTVRNAQAVRDRAEEDLDAFLDEHGNYGPHQKTN